MRTLTLLSSLALLGCKAPVEAPSELNELSRYLYREWDNEDPEVMQRGLENLAVFMDGLDMDAGVNDRSFLMEPPTAEDLADIDRPEERDPADMLGVSVAFKSQWTVADHARLQKKSDQTPTEPTAESYARDADPSDCFTARSCDTIRTVNEIRRENFLMKVNFTLYKDFRWVDVDGGQALISRSWTDQIWEGDGGDGAIYQSHSIDVWMPDGNSSRRWQLVWSESDVGVSDEDLITGTLKVTVDNIFDKGDKAIDELFYAD
ncbi:MAG: hypothetical protein AAFV53_20330 [Myxococcota bacterium]